MHLRPYQQEAIDGILDKFERHQSTLLMLATGLGKTVVFTHLAKHYKPLGRIMVIAHREELIYQASEHVKRITGDAPDIEMASEWATSHDIFKADIVVSTVQTQNAGMNGDGRMTRFEPNEFSLLVLDEAHHCIADSYRYVIDYYRKNPNLRILGVTATPNRTDEAALGQIFESVAYEYDILDGIEDGWLVPINEQFVTVESLDFSKIRTTCGDLNGKDLAEVMEYEENLHAIAHPAFEIASGRKTLLFAASVPHAERICEILNRHKPNCAQFVCAKTDKDIRRDIIGGFRNSEFQFLCQVGIATEGFDVPDIECIAMARPTKSRSLYCQMMGRGTRPLPGIVDGLDSAEQRKAAIAASSKPAVEIIDFVGNAGRHKLVHSADILGGKYSDEIVERAKKNASKQGGSRNTIAELQKAEREIAAEARAEEQAAARSKILARAKYLIATVNPFDVLDITPWRERAWHKGRQPTPKMLEMLANCGVDTAGMSFTHAGQVIKEIIKRRQEGRCSYKQAKVLRKFKIDPEKISFQKASEIIDGLAKKYNWPSRKAV